ncbi:hypothetical protein MCBRY_000909 [Methylocystis bryophila]
MIELRKERIDLLQAINHAAVASQSLTVELEHLMLARGLSNRAGFSGRRIILLSPLPDSCCAYRGQGDGFDERPVKRIGASFPSDQRHERSAMTLDAAFEVEIDERSLHVARRQAHSADELIEGHWRR